MISWNEFVRKLLALDVLWGAKNKKVTGIRDSAAVSTQNVNITPTSITFISLPDWIQNISPSKPKYAIIKIYGHPNDGKKIAMTGVSGTTVTFIPANPSESIISYSGIAQIDGRVGAAINNEKIASLTKDGHTRFNLSNLQPNLNSDGSIMPDGSGIALNLSDHYHESPVTHEYNNAGTKLKTYDEASNTFIDDGPKIVIDNKGRVVVI